MTDISSKGPSVLLPEAKIDIFALSDATRSLGDMISGDWRFGRVQLTVSEGGTDQAIELYSTMDSPDLLIIETDRIDDEFTKRLEILGGHCTEGTNALVIGPVNDIELYRKLKEMGVRDYYVHPITGEAVINDIVEILIESKGLSDTRIFSFIGAKGGIGTTLAAQSMALSIAQKAGQPCLMVDCAMGRSYTSIALAGAEPNGSMAEAIRAAQANDQERLGRMIVPSSIDGLSILSTGAEAALSEIGNAQGMDQLLDLLSIRFPNIIVDLGGADAQTAQAILKKSNDIILLSDAGLVSLRDARALVNEITSLRGEDQKGLYYLINRIGEHGNAEVGRKDITQAIGLAPKAGIPYDPKLLTNYELSNNNIEDIEAGAKLIRAMTDIFGLDTPIDKNLDKSEKKTTGIGGFLNKFTS